VGNNADQDGEIGTGFGDFDTPYDIGINFIASSEYASMPGEYCQQHS
jgi:hypothetical protein